MHALKDNMNSVWLLYGFLLGVSIGLSYGFIQAFCNLSFDNLKKGTVKKVVLLTPIINLLAFAFEFVYHIYIYFLKITISPGKGKFCQAYNY